jgi:glycerol-3-phosphate dehydrogenase
MMMERSEKLAALAASATGGPAAAFDVLVIGGGATGLGIAVDAATRGFRTALVEAGDFAQATSARSTKLVHGGVRYLASGQVHLVYEALHERAVMMRNAPHLVKAQAFLLPAYKAWELPYYGAGLMAYDLLSGRASMGSTRLLGRQATLRQIPNLQPDSLSGSVLYHDGQFNDARLALALARTAEDHGATMLNYARCTRLTHAEGKVTGAIVTDVETGEEFAVCAKAVFNATGIFTDATRRMDDVRTPPLLTVSRGTHLVVSAAVLGGSAGIMVPKTRDGRVIFAIPWQGKVVIGTTDLPADQPAMEPGHSRDEIEFLLETVNPYLAKKIGEEDILSVFSGLRPLVTGQESKTSKISREHHIDVSETGLVTVAGGKWTTYRRMAEDAMSFAAGKGLLERRHCVTAKTLLHGTEPEVANERQKYLQEVPREASGTAPQKAEYGTDSCRLDALVAAEPVLAGRLDPELPYTMSQVVFAVREEMARTLEDVLSRRTRALLLDERAALRAAPRVAERMRVELGQTISWRDAQIEAFALLAHTGYTSAVAAELTAAGARP